MVKFQKADNVYNDYIKKYNYKKHKKGYVILGPPGIGKTTFVRNQKTKNWIDQDDLFNDLGLDWHYNEKNENDFKLNYLRCDYMSEQSKCLGFRIIGALFWDYNPDAIVIPDLKLHKQYLAKRKDLDYTSIINLRKELFKKARKNNIPLFKDIISATQYLENL